MKKQFVVGIQYMTRGGNLGSQTYSIEAENHEEAMEIGRGRANGYGRSKFSGDCVEINEEDEY